MAPRVVDRLAEHELPRQPAQPGPEALGLAWEQGPEPVVQRPGEQVDPRHGGEGELEGHAGRRIGVGRQQEHQDGKEGGGAVVLPPHQGRQQQHGLHEGRPQHRRGVPHRGGEEEHKGDADHGGAPPPRPQQGGQAPRQKGHVKAGHRDHVGQAGTPEGGVLAPVHTRILAGDQGGDQGRGPAGEGPLHAVLQGPGRIGRPRPPGRAGRAGYLRLPLAVGHQQDALGVVVVGVLPGDGVRQAQLRRNGQPVTGPQPGGRIVQVQPGGDGQALLRTEVHQHRAAVGGLPGPVRRRGGDGALRPRQGLGRGVGQLAIGARPRQARRQPQAGQHHPPAVVTLEQQPQQGRQGTRRPRREQKPLRQQVYRQEDRRREGAGKPRQLTHGAASGRQSGPGYSPCWCGRAPPA